MNPLIAATVPPPVMEARRWLKDIRPDPERPLLNVSQAAPAAPPPEGLRQAIADAALRQDSAHLYGPVLGLPELREALAEHWSRLYGGTVGPGQVAITPGCNQAFVAAMATLARSGEEVILPSPWYFNHKMWLDMQGVRAVPLITGNTLLPDPEQARALITPKTRAIVLVTPNNPGGVEYPARLLSAFAELCRAHNIALVLDETYRDFLGHDGRPHDLLADPDWHDTVIVLYSFSKAYRLTGHRVGAIIASGARLAEAEKFLDTVAICPAQLGQHGALWGIRHLGDWLRGERAEMLRRREAIAGGFRRLNGWTLLGCGAYFAYAEHPFTPPSDVLARALVREAGVLLLPGTMFMPETDPAGGRQVRIAFANIGEERIDELFRRLAALAPARTSA